MTKPTVKQIRYIQSLMDKACRWDIPKIETKEDASKVIKWLLGGAVRECKLEESNTGGK